MSAGAASWQQPDQIRSAGPTDPCVIGLTSESADLAPEECQPIVGALSGLGRSRSGRLASDLQRRWMAIATPDCPPERFLKYCYNRRNALVHARTDHPSTQEGNVLAANLSRFVGDLLGGRPVAGAAAHVGRPQTPCNPGCGRRSATPGCPIVDRRAGTGYCSRRQPGICGGVPTYAESDGLVRATALPSGSVTTAKWAPQKAS